MAFDKRTAAFFDDILDEIHLLPFRIDLREDTGDLFHGKTFRNQETLDTVDDLKTPFLFPFHDDQRQKKTILSDTFRQSGIGRKVIVHFVIIPG